MIDKKSARGKLARRLRKLTREHGFAKTAYGFQRSLIEVVQTVQIPRYGMVDPPDVFQFDILLKVYSPEMHERIYGEPGPADVFSQVRAELLELSGEAGGSTWAVRTEAEFEASLDDLARRFSAFGIPFLDKTSTTQSVLQLCEAGKYVAKSGRLASWEAAYYQGQVPFCTRP